MTGTYVATPQAIVDEGERLGAERICFWDGSYSFTGVDVAEVEVVLPQKLSGRFKFQARSVGRWKDLGRYRHIVDAELLTELERQTFGQPPGFSPTELEAAAAAQPRRFHGALRRLLYDTIERQLRRPVRDGLTGLVGYFAQFEDTWAADDYFQYFLTYFRLFDLGFGHGLARLIKAPEAEAVSELTQLLQAALGDADRSPGADAAARCVIGQVWSLVDRRAAAEEFVHLRSTRAAELIRHYYWDSGALTYYVAEEISGTACDDAAGIVASIEPLRIGEKGNSVGVGLSVDPAFFRIYGAWLYFYAQQLPEVDFNLFLCADMEEGRRLIAEGDEFVAALARLNLAGHPPNVHFYRVPTPPYGGREITFYACARFFAAELLLAEYANVYLMDIDLYPADNPMSFFEEVKATVFAAPTTETCISLSPWRRYMAGNVPLSREISTTTILTDLQAYIAHGLRNGGDWMLDQNALAYVIERDRESTRAFEPLNKFRRPFVGSRFMNTWESNYRRTNRPNETGVTA